MITAAVNSKYTSRKFGLAVASWLVSSLALFTGHLAGSEYVMITGVILGMYKFANVAEGKNDK